MKRDSRLLPLLTAVGLLFGQAVSAADGDVLAVVNGKKITEAEYQRYNKQGDDGHGHGPNREQMLQEMINIELINADALTKNYDKDAEFAAAMEEMRRTQLAAYTVRKTLAAATAGAEAEIKAEYERLIAGMPRHEYKARHIMLDSEGGAKEIVAALDRGGKFEELAREKSIDDYAEQGGDLGWFTLDQMEDSFADALKGLKSGEYTKAPVKTSYGWHVIQLEERRDLAPPALEQLEGQIRNSLLNKRFVAYIEALRAKAKIEIK